MPEEQSIRPFLAALERSGELLRIGKTVDPRFEISAFLSACDGGPAVLFEHVNGSPLPVLGNVLTGRARIARALGVGIRELLPALRRSIHAPVPPCLVQSAPVQAIVEERAPLAGLPAPTFFERESHPYITAGTIIARDPESGRGNLSFARCAILDERRAMIGIAPNHHLALFARRAAAAGRALEIAVVIGAHPAVQLAACLYLGVGDDEMHCAGSLLGAPVELVRARTVDLAVPANAELVLEGVIDPQQSVPEGWVSEFHGMYEDYGAGYLASFRAQTRRTDALFQVIEPGYHREHLYLGALPIAAGLLNTLAGLVPNVLDVALTEAGSGRTDAVVQIREPRPGQARRVMLAALAAVSIIKRVTVVDADVDPWDATAVEWARTNRMRLERDLLLVPLAGADRSEPLEAGGLVTKVGFDATAKPADRAEGIERALPPRSIRDEARRWLIENVPPAQRRGWLAED